MCKDVRFENRGEAKSTTTADKVKGWNLIPFSIAICVIKRDEKRRKMRVIDARTAETPLPRQGLVGFGRFSSSSVSN